MNRFFALVLLAFGFAGAARADYIPATWVDVATDANNVYIGERQSFTYTHNLNDTGFRPLTDLITSFHLSINLADDQRNDAYELAFVDIPGFTGDSFVSRFGLAGEEYGGFSILGLLQLNALGTLTVTINSIFGDFNLVNSTITAQGLRQVANVPEPGALGLLGVGLVGIALSKRRRKQAAQA
ncbi:PEP-CTERM sorting domain-containing protein [Steroidobacter flavus]|uniref:PEP-CTERM sorting domain-containing protein n=1 Tax=Steroidobacter flavus TaxID=1842136 RepID=A0ABV8SSM2_9GAMM